VDLPLPVSIPADYVADRDTRLRLYRRMADLRSLTEIEMLAEEFADRFGPLPETLDNLLVSLKIKILAEKAGLVSVSNESGQVVFRFPALPEGAPPRAFPQLDGLSGYNLRTGKNALWMPVGNQPEWVQRILDVLQALA